MEAILECCCGLDVHRDTVVACLLKGPQDLKPEATLKTFSALPNGLEKLRTWLEWICYLKSIPDWNHEKSPF